METETAAILTAIPTLWVLVFTAAIGVAIRLPGAFGVYRFCVFNGGLEGPNNNNLPQGHKKALSSGKRNALVGHLAREDFTTQQHARVGRELFYPWRRLQAALY